MSQRSKNLLEAFNQSKAPEKSAEPVAQPRGSAPRVGGPFADSTPAVRQKAPPALHGARTPAADGAHWSSQRWRILVLCAAVAGIFFYVGRLSAPAVQASAPDSPAGSAATPAAPSPAGAQPANITGNDAALSNPANKATILAITYKHTDEFKKLATDAKARLIAQDLPASVYENPGKKQIYVLVGAAPKTSDLDKLLVRVKAAISDRGKADFSSAYAVPIDNYVERRNR